MRYPFPYEPWGTLEYIDDLLEFRQPLLDIVLMRMVPSIGYTQPGILGVARQISSAIVRSPLSKALLCRKNLV